MTTMKFKIHVLLQQNKNDRNCIVSHIFSVNILMHLCTNDSNFRAYCRLGKSEIAKIIVFHFGPKNRENFGIKHGNDKSSRFIHVRLRKIFPRMYVFI